MALPIVGNIQKLRGLVCPTEKEESKDDPENVEQKKNQCPKYSGAHNGCNQRVTAE